jgi:hypothetical protein
MINIEEKIPVLNVLRNVTSKLTKWLKQPLSDKAQTNNHVRYPQACKIHPTPSRIFNFNIIRLSTSLCPMVTSLQRLTLTFYRIYYFHHACYMASSSHSSRFNYFKSVWAIVQIYKALQCAVFSNLPSFSVIKKSFTQKDILKTQWYGRVPAGEHTRQIQNSK